MKKIFTLIAILITIFFTGCNLVPANNYGEYQKVATSKDTVLTNISQYLAEFPNSFLNPIQEEKLLQLVFLEIVTHENAISEIPFTLSNMRQFEGYWILTFDGNYGSLLQEVKVEGLTGVQYSHKPEIKLYVYSKVSESVAETLIRHNTYFLKGDFNTGAGKYLMIQKSTFNFGDATIADLLHDINVSVVLDNVEIRESYE